MKPNEKLCPYVGCDFRHDSEAEFARHRYIKHHESAGADARRAAARRENAPVRDGAVKRAS